MRVWWCEDVYQVIKAKRNCFKTRQKNRCASEEKFKLYKLANKEAKSVNEANYKAYDTLYARLGSKKEK